MEELGAERVKGLLLYGPPGCGKSLLAARLAAGLSRRPPTVVSGPEIMDKYGTRGRRSGAPSRPASKHVFSRFCNARPTTPHPSRLDHN